MNVSLAEALHILRCRLSDHLSPAESRELLEAIHFICAQDELKEEPAWMRPSEKVESATPRAQCPRCGEIACIDPDSKGCSDNVIGRLERELASWKLLAEQNAETAATALKQRDAAQSASAAIPDNLVLVSRSFLEATPCPNCGGSGFFISTGPDPEQEQCQWCYEKHMILSGADRAA